jgi:hypothetical protein
MEILDLIIAGLLVILIYVLLRRVSNYDADPRSVVWAKGQQLVGGTPLVLGSTSIPLSPQPTLPPVATYSMSFDLYLDPSVPSQWLELMASSTDVSWDGGPTFNKSNQPLFSVNWNNGDPNKGKYLFRHVGPDVTTGTNGDQNGNSPVLSSGQWYNLTFVIDSVAKTISYYQDGVRVGGYTFTVPPVWSTTTPQNWVWNRGLNGSGSKIQNAYFFNTALSPSDASLLKYAPPPPVVVVAPVTVPAAPGPAPAAPGTAPVVAPGPMPVQIGGLTLGGAPTYQGPSRKIMLIDI